MHKFFIFHYQNYEFVIYEPCKYCFSFCTFINCVFANNVRSLVCLFWIILFVSLLSDSRVKLTSLLEESFRFNFFFFFSHVVCPLGIVSRHVSYFCRLEEVLVHLHGAVQLLLQMEEEVVAPVATPKAERCLTVLEPMVLPIPPQLLRIMHTRRPLTARLGVKDPQQVWKVRTTSHCLKITQNVAFEFLNSGIFHQFLSY